MENEHTIPLLRHNSKQNKLNLWELQKTLDRGDFIEVTPF